MLHLQYLWLCYLSHNKNKNIKTNIINQHIKNASCIYSSTSFIESRGPTFRYFPDSYRATSGNSDIKLTAPWRQRQTSDFANEDNKATFNPRDLSSLRLSIVDISQRKLPMAGLKFFFLSFVLFKLKESCVLSNAFALPFFLFFLVCWVYIAQLLPKTLAFPPMQPMQYA